MASSRPSYSSHTSHGPPSANGHGGASLLNQKSRVVAGVQDAYWSDEEQASSVTYYCLLRRSSLYLDSSFYLYDTARVASRTALQEEPECPLCVGQMDMDDWNFKPCPCGYQICRFCYHHIKQNLNGLCPACRRKYSDETVEWKAMSSEDRDRLNKQKKQKEKEKKELEALRRAHLPSMRVVQRNVVYVTGLGPRFAKEELIPSLRSHEYFGQYGKINKIVLVKRTPKGSSEPIVGVYITYNRREDATRAVMGIDGSPSPGGGAEVMRASYGTTKYCMNFLRNVGCTNISCMELHEWGDEKDTFTKDDLVTLKHLMKETETTGKFIVGKEADTLPRTAAWGTKANQANTSPKPANLGAVIATAQNRTARSSRTRPSTTASISSRVSEVSRPNRTTEQEKERDRERKGHTHSVSSGSGGAPPGLASSMLSRAKSPSSSRPSTPLASGVPFRPSSTTTDSQATAPSSSTTSSPAGWSRPIDVSPKPSVESSKQRLSPLASAPAAASSLPSYQPSSQAQALLDDLRHRRETKPKILESPFPDLDRTLAALKDDGFSFSFQLDPSLIPRTSYQAPPPPQQSSFDPWALPNTTSQTAQDQATLPPPPGLGAPPPTTRTYAGSFDPFSDVPPSSIPDDVAPRSSRFGFAKKRLADFSGSESASPMGIPSELLPQTPLFSTSDVMSPTPSSSNRMPQWMQQSQDFGTAAPPGMRYPSAGMRSPHFAGTPGFPSSFGSSPESALKDMLNIGRMSGNRRADGSIPNYGQPPFSDPAIMSMRMTDSPGTDSIYSNGLISGRPPMGTSARHNLPMGAPPGLLAMPPPGLQRPLMDNRQVNGHLIPTGPIPIQNAQSDGLADSVLSGFRAVTLGPQPPEPSSLHTTSFQFQHQDSFVPSQPLSSASVSMAVATPSDLIPEHHLTDSPPSPAFTSSDFPELSSAAPLDSRPLRRDSSASRHRKTEIKLIKKVPAHVMTHKVPEAVTVSEPFVQDELPVERPTMNGQRQATSSPISTPAMSEATLEKEITHEGSGGLPTVGVPVVQPVSRKARRLQAKALQSKAKHSQKNTPSVTPLMSQTPISPMSPPAPASLPLSPQADPLRLESALIEESLPAVSQPVAENKYSVGTSGIEQSHDSPSPLQGSLEVVVSDAPTPGLSRKARKILAAKAAKEAAEIQASVVQPDELLSTFDDTEHPLYPSIKSVTELYEDLRKAFPPEVFLAPSNLRNSSSVFHGAAVSHEPLVDAYTTLSLGGSCHLDGSPGSGLAMSSLQSLLVSLTETISEVLTMLPPGEHQTLNLSILDIMDRDTQAKKAPSMEELTAADGNLESLTAAVERHSEWMKDQLEKLEALHRQVNLAAMDTVAAAEEAGWKSIGGVRSLPRISADPLGGSRDMSMLGMEELGSLLAEAIKQEKVADEAFKENLGRLDL